MPNLRYLATMASTCRQLAVQAKEPETAFNLFELAKVYDDQIQRASGPKPDLRIKPVPH